METQFTKKDQVYFCKLKIGDKFREELPHPTVYYGTCDAIYIKDSKSRGKCILQTGYGNQRMIGGLFCFGPFRSVFEVGEK